MAESRLVELADGRIGYVLKKRWRDGTTHVVMTKQVLVERLCALVPGGGIRGRSCWRGCFRSTCGCARIAAGGVGG